MKNLLIILTLFVSVLSFGQSKKELNVAYRREMNRLNVVYDSCVTVYLSSEKQLEKSRKNVRTQVRNVDKEKQSALNRYKTVIEYKEKLVALGYDVNSLVSVDEMKTDIPSVYQYDEKLFKDIYSFKSVRDTLILDKLKIKEENLLLLHYIDLYKTALPVNRDVIEREQVNIHQLDSIYYSLDSIKKQYEETNSYYQTKYKILDDKLKELKENYRLKGPKGFPEAYAREFPDVFPKHFIVGSSEDNSQKNIQGNTESMDREDWPIEIKEPPAPPVTVIETVDEFAEFPGGVSALRKYLSDNLVYPQTAKELEIEGKCFLKFMVDEDGSISNIQIAKGVTDCRECDMEAVRLVKSMPNWKPGKMKGQAVKSMYTLPILFKLK